MFHGNSLNINILIINVVFFKSRHKVHFYLICKNLICSQYLVSLYIRNPWNQKECLLSITVTLFQFSHQGENENEAHTTSDEGPWSKEYFAPNGPDKQHFICSMIGTNNLMNATNANLCTGTSGNRGTQHSMDIFFRTLKN